MLWFFVAIFEAANSTSDLKEKNTSEKLEARVMNTFLFENLMLGLCQAPLPKTRQLIKAL